MTVKIAHVIGNGDSAPLYKPSKGFKITCNLPPFAIDNVYTTCIVDFKMMKAIAEGSVTVPGDWVLGARPKKFMEMNPSFYMKYAGQVKEFFTELPSYAENYTNFNCGHMAVYYAAKRLGCKEINLYGFDSMFDLNLRSYSDLFLPSDRDPSNSLRLSNNWRPIWQQMFKELSDTKFVLHHRHSNVKFDLPENAQIVVHTR